ncbi:hypothetical protein F5B21DRAFT_455703 [Xylaria acuta]|nr:hypothetical protein F5B21DRAFT_455703 [Xylaria acuta]
MKLNGSRLRDPVLSRSTPGLPLAPVGCFSAKLWLHVHFACCPDTSIIALLYTEYSPSNALCSLLSPLCCSQPLNQHCDTILRCSHDPKHPIAFAKRTR